MAEGIRIDPHHKTPFLLSEREKIRRQLKGEPTGFDILVDQKIQNLNKLKKFLDSNPNFTLKQTVELLGCSFRTAARYRTIIREELGMVDKVTELIEGKKERKRKLRIMIKNNPEVSFTEQFKKLGISDRTGRKYLKEMQ